MAGSFGIYNARITEDAGDGTVVDGHKVFGTRPNDYGIDVLPRNEALASMASGTAPVSASSVLRIAKLSPVVRLDEGLDADALSHALDNVGKYPTYMYMPTDVPDEGLAIDDVSKLPVTSPRVLDNGTWNVVFDYSAQDPLYEVDTMLVHESGAYHRLDGVMRTDTFEDDILSQIEAVSPYLGKVPADVLDSCAKHGLELPMSYVQMVGIDDGDKYATERAVTEARLDLGFAVTSHVCPNDGPVTDKQLDRMHKLAEADGSEFMKRAASLGEAGNLTKNEASLAIEGHRKYERARAAGNLADGAVERPADYVNIFGKSELVLVDGVVYDTAREEVGYADYANEIDAFDIDSFEIPDELPENDDMTDDYDFEANYEPVYDEFITVGDEELYPRIKSYKDNPSNLALQLVDANGEPKHVASINPGSDMMPWTVLVDDVHVKDLGDRIHDAAWGESTLGTMSVALSNGKTRRFPLYRIFPDVMERIDPKGCEGYREKVAESREKLVGDMRAEEAGYDDEPEVGGEQDEQDDYYGDF